MKFYVLLLIVFYSTIVYCQDTIIKTDGIKLISKITEITPVEIKYKRFDYLNGPLFIISKNNVAKIIFENGLSENISYIAPAPKDTFIYINTYKPSSPWLRFKIEIGAEVNNAYVNMPSIKSQNAYSKYSDEYSGYDKNNVKSSLNIGLCFLFGRRPHFNSVFGINHLKSKGEYIYDNFSSGLSSGSGGYISSHTHFKYNSQIDYLNFFGGFRFTIGKHLHLEPLIVLNYILHRNEKVTGSATTTMASGGPIGSSTYTQDIKYYNNQPAPYTNIETSLSLLPRMSYDFNIKPLKFDAYVSYNVNVENQIPWWMFGVSFFPFKKLN